MMIYYFIFLFSPLQSPAGTPPPGVQPPTQPNPEQNAVNGVPADEVPVKPAASLPIGPPEFTKPMLAQRYVEGSRCRFSCQVQGNPEPKITWLRHGKPIDTGYR